MALKLLYFLSILALHSCFRIKRPNIVFIVADDVGWNDLSLHGSEQIMTPNIDLIALQGILLENYYTDAQGTASRSAMFTGKYPMRIGTQGVSIGAAEDRGIPVTERLLPSYLQDLGYATHLVGKWGLGKSREYFLPMYRGFDTFYGFLGSSVDYFTYNHVTSCNGSEFYGLDLFNNSEPVFNQSGHLTEVLTDQAIRSDIHVSKRNIVASLYIIYICATAYAGRMRLVIKEHDQLVPLYLHVAHAAAHTGGGLVNLQPSRCSGANDHIAHTARRLFADQLHTLDKGIGEIVSALAETEMINNTIIVFTLDHGAPSTGPDQNFGSNLPLRGTKGTPWEGAVRSAAALWHNNLDPQIWQGLFHVSDWMPTLISAAGGNVTDPIDGIDQWNAMIFDEAPPRTEAVIAVDDLKGWGALRDGDFKIIVGNLEQCVSEYYGKGLMKTRSEEPLYEKALHDSETALVFREVLDTHLNMSQIYMKLDSCKFQSLDDETNDTQLCIPTKAKGCLFNITADPSETKDLWYKRPDIVKRLSLRFRLLWSEINPRRQPSCDVRADPSVHSANNYIWYPWLDGDEPVPEPIVTEPRYPLQMTNELFQYYVDLNLKKLRQKLTAYVKNMTDSFVDNMSSLF